MQLFVDQLTNLDFSYLDPERGLVGETWLASVLLDGALDNQGMVCDFGVVKKACRNWLDRVIDHCLLVPGHHPAITIESTDNSHRVSCTLTDGNKIVCQSPRAAITIIETDRITGESVAEWAKTQLKALFPSSVQQLSLSFNIETIQGPYYHYSHGLKKHQGNCQRIAHGHRSKIEIRRNNQLANADMQQWAETFRDIYIGTRDDLLPAESTPDNRVFCYSAEQGDFYLSLPDSLCYLIDTDSTVEYIAHHLATTLKQKYPNEQIQVRAYEGLAKGAICTL